MKTRNIITGLFLSLSFLSCKNDKKNEVLKEEKVKPNTFDVILDIVIKKDDELIIYYKDGSNEWFDDNHAVWATVKGSEQKQSVVFNLPEGVLPTDLRLDIGRNEFKSQSPIEIKKFKISYLNKSFDIIESQIEMYLKPNKYLKFNTDTKTYSLEKDANGGYDAFFESRATFYPEINKVAMSL